ncbi:hypothetical protein P7K49_013486 [Saguinus oedipus]|uniref:C2orf72-like C-terminal domain-containing protein n=1 Tax=Saguinus oedipus TaxID=9490 RepID=A0ABQ9VGL9_SAGOE|nr:hypothetical protein P7K49_013486 [Saguinus oedipus]
MAENVHTKIPPGGLAGLGPRGRVLRSGAPPPGEAGNGGRRGRVAASMERELEALAARPTHLAEPPFQALVEAAGGRGQVLLVGELWEREQSRALLLDFARAVFPPEPGAGKPSGAAAEGAGPRAAGARAIRSPLVFVLCRATSLAAGEPRRRLREMLRDVRGRRRAGAALAGPEDGVALGLRLLEALLRAVFGRQAGGPVQAAAYCPGRPASCLALPEPGDQVRLRGARRGAGGRWLGHVSQVGPL